MGLSVDFDLSEFKRELERKQEQYHKAARPAAQAGAQVVYEQARLNAQTLRSKKEHYFYGTTAKKAPKGQKQNFRYGPFKPGTLHDSIYQVFSKSNSTDSRVTYHISWNATKAPYGAMVELGTSKAAAHAFIGPAIVGARDRAIQAMRVEFVNRVEAA